MYKFHSISMPAILMAIATAGCGLLIPQTASCQRLESSLNGEWQFQRVGDDNEWKRVTLPNSFEEHEGAEFDGAGVYQKIIPPIQLPAGTRAILHFQAVATQADVWFDGTR